MELKGSRGFGIYFLSPPYPLAPRPACFQDIPPSGLPARTQAQPRLLPQHAKPDQGSATREQVSAKNL